MSNLRDPFFAPSTVSLDEMEQLRASGRGSLRRGWESGLIGADANSLRAKEYGLRADGKVAEADALLPQIQGLRQRQAMYAPEVQKVEDADGIGSGLSWLGGQIGQGAASMATPMAATTALSAVGTLGGMIPGPVGTAAKLIGTVGAPLAAVGINQRQMKGEWLENAVQDKALMEQYTPEQLNRAANIQGVVGGALDTVLPTVVGRQLAGTGLRKGMDALGFGGRTALNLLGEGLTEVGQGETGRQIHGYMNPNRDTSGDMSDRLNELAGGMAGSSPFGVAGAAADTAYRGVGTAGAKVKNAAGQVVDLAQEAYDGSSLQGAVGKGVDKVTNFVGSAKRKTGDIVDLARGEDGKVDLGKALDLADQELQARAKEYVGADQGTMPAFTLDDRERDLFDFDERRPGAVPEDILNAAPEVQQKWFADHDALRADAVATRLAEIEDTSPEATALLDRIEQGDYAAVDEGAKFLLGRADEQEYRDLNTRAGLAKSVAEKALGSAGKAVGKAATAATPYIGKAAGMAGKGIVAGARGLMDMGKAVAQGAKDEYQSGKKLNAQGMERSPGDVFRDILTAELSNTGRPVGEALSGYIGGWGAELNALADSWGSRNPEGAAAGLGLRIGAIANDLRIAYGAKAPAVVQQLRDVADPAAGPMFDMLGDQVAKSGTPQGRLAREQLRVNAANQLMRYVPPEQAARLQAAGKDYRLQLLGAIERIADGTANPSVRPALIEALGGGKQGEATLRTMMDIVNGATPEPERANEAAMFADSPGVDDPTGDDIGSDADVGDVNDFEKRQAEKSVRRGTAPAIYGYARGSALRTSSEKNFDPFAPSKSGGKRPNLVTMEDRDTTTGNRTIDNRVTRMEAQLGMARTPERMAELMREEGNRAGADKVRQLIARGDDKAKATLDDAVKSFFVNRSGEYSVRARSAQDVMDDLGYQPTKQLAIYRDYLKQEGNEEAANEVRAAIAAISRNSKNTKVVAEQGRVAAPEFTEQIEKVQRDARAYFRDRYMAVAEQLSDRTPEKLTAQEVLVMHDQAKRAMHNIEGAVYKQGLKGEDAEKAQNRMISDANILVFESKSGKPVMVRANALAGWARAQRDTYETDTKDGSEDFGSFSSRTKDDQFVEDLLSGINAVLASGAVRGTTVKEGQNTYTAKLPYKINPFGKREQFGDPKFPGGLPPSLGLATETEFTRQGRREKRTAEITRAERVFGPPQALNGNPARDASVDVGYQERVAIDQAKGERERKSIDGGDERTPVIESLNAESLMTPQESRHYDRLKTAKGRKDFLKRLGLRGEGAKFNTNTTIDEALIDYDDDSKGKTELDFKQADRRDADEFEDAQFRNKNSGKSVYDPLPFETKLDAARKADERSGPILRALMGDFQEKDELGGMFGRAESDPGAVARAQGLQMLAQRIEAAAGVQRGSAKMTGGVQYLYPAAKVLNPHTINSLAQVDGAPETFRRDLVALRRQAVLALKAAGENASTMHKVNLMRLMAGDPRTITDANVDQQIIDAISAMEAAGLPTKLDVGRFLQGQERIGGDVWTPPGGRGQMQLSPDEVGPPRPQKRRPPTGKARESGRPTEDQLYNDPEARVDGQTDMFRETYDPRPAFPGAYRRTPSTVVNPDGSVRTVSQEYVDRQTARAKANNEVATQVIGGLAAKARESARSTKAAPEVATTNRPKFRKPRFGGVALGNDGPHGAKDQAKSDQATKFIGRGSPASSTAKYAAAWGERANTGVYTPSDTVFISAEGNRKVRLDPDFTEIGRATQAGATILTDDAQNRDERPYNVGERQVAEFLTKQGYAEVSPGRWMPGGVLASRIEALARARSGILKKFEPTIRDGVISALTKRSSGMTKAEVFRSPDVAVAFAMLSDAKLRGVDGAQEAIDTMVTTIDQIFGLPYEPALEADFMKVLGRDDVQRNLSAYMARILRSNLPAGAKAIAKAVGKVAGGTPVTGGDMLAGGADGNFRALIGDIQVTRAPIGGVAHTVLHEGVHAATVRALMTNPELHAATYALMAHVVKHDPKLAPAYGLANTLEFMAEGLSNAELQRRLYKIPANSTVAKYLGQTVANAWAAFTALVRKALNLPAEHQSALTQLIELGGQAMKQTAADGQTTVTREQSKDFGARPVVPGSTVRRLAEAIADSPLIDEQGRSELRQHLASGLKEEKYPHAFAMALATARDKLAAEAARLGRPLTGSEADALSTEVLKEVSGSVTAVPSTTGVRLNAQADADAGTKTAKGPGLTAKQEREVRKYVNKVLGPKIKVVFSDTMQHSGEWDPATQTIKIATAAASGVNSAAYHEALHAFFGAYAKNDPKVLRVMQSLTDDPKIMERVQALLYKYPAAQAQLTDGEERMAYIYQFWAAGQLDLPAGKAKTWLQKLSKFFRQALGLVKDSERAVELLEAFHGGELRKPSVAAKVIADLTADKAWTVKARRNFDGLLQQVGRLTMPAQDILRDSPSKAAQSLMAAFYANPGDEAGGGQGEGYLNARKSETIRRKNALARAIEGLSERDQLDVVKALQQGVDPQDVAQLPYAPVRAAVGAIRAELDDFHDYMTAKGLQVGKIKDYFPVVWSTQALQDKRDEFISMLMTKYRKEINGDADQAEKIYQGLISRTIADGIVDPNRDDGVMSPAFESMEERKLDWIKPEDREPFLNKSLVGTLTKYFNQGVRRAEYTARFGEDGEGLSRQLDVIQDELKAEGQAMVKRGELKDEDAGKKWAARQYRDVSQAVGAMTGTLGKDISEGWRKATSWATVYQNVRLLPLSIFASMVDPLSIVARGGDFKLAGEVFMNGMREVLRNWKEMITGMPEERQKTEWEHLAELVGATEAAMFAHHVADEYASEYMSPRARKINDFMFRANGMESWNRQMRVGATKGAVLFIEKHSKLPEAHSKRWLAELGLKAEDVVFNQDGRMILDARELALQTGMSTGQAKEQVARLHFAVNRWVEGAVLTPNSAQRPAWSSDPRWAFLFHLKQFTYSFHQTILKRAWNELKHGNMAPMGAMAWAVPTMIAADTVKGMVTGMGELPAHMKGYDMADWFKHGVDRAGLTGYGQLGMEAVSDPASLGGPMVEQIIDAFRQPLKETAVEAMPLMPLYKRALI